MGNEIAPSIWSDPLMSIYTLSGNTAGSYALLGKMNESLFHHMWESQSFERSPRYNMKISELVLRHRIIWGTHKTPAGADIYALDRFLVMINKIVFI